MRKRSEAFLSAQFPDVLPYLTETPEKLADRAVGEIVSVRCDVLHHAGSVLLLGDAAHAVVPFMGQGVNIGLEDCQVLAESLDEYGSDLEQAFAAVSERQLPEGLACADLSEWNYSELISGHPAAAVLGKESLVSQVNFSGLSYRSVAERAMPNWRPRVAVSPKSTLVSYTEPPVARGAASGEGRSA